MPRGTVRRAFVLVCIAGSSRIRDRGRRGSLWTGADVAAAGGPQMFTANAERRASRCRPARAAGTGTGTVLHNRSPKITRITVNLSFSGLTSNAIAGHIHGPAAAGANAGVLFDFAGVVPAATSGSIPRRPLPSVPRR
jgi:hypothetical protein